MDTPLFSAEYAGDVHLLSLGLPIGRAWFINPLRRGVTGSDESKRDVSGKCGLDHHRWAAYPLN
jgi:hypothetical protein